MNILERRCVELSYKHKLTHISSVLNTVNVLADIYANRKPDDPVVLGNGHAALALFVVLEAWGICPSAEYLVAKHGTHANRDMNNGIWVTCGSLGQAETVAVGMALADRTRTVHLVTSDGSLAEGSCWEALHFASNQRLDNLQTYVIANGLTGYGAVNVSWLNRRLQTACFTPFEVIQPKMPWPWLQGLKGHYSQLTESQYQEMIGNGSVKEFVQYT